MAGHLYLPWIGRAAPFEHPIVTPTHTPAPLPTSTPTPSCTPTRTPSVTPTATESLPLIPHQTTLEPSADTYLYAWAPTENFGSSTTLVLRSGGITAALLRFDLTNLPADAQVTSARLETTILTRSNPNAMSARYYRLLQAWDEASADYTHATATQLWDAPLAAGDGDREPNQLAELVLPEVGVVMVDVTDLVRNWFAQPASNFGVLMQGDSSGSVHYSFASREESYAPQRPKLYLEYLSRAPMLAAQFPAARAEVTDLLSVSVEPTREIDK